MSDLVGRLRENADLEEDRYPPRTINVPAGHAAYIYPVTTDPHTILEHGNPRGAAAHVRHHIDNDEQEPEDR